MKSRLPWFWSNVTMQDPDRNALDPDKREEVGLGGANGASFSAFIACTFEKEESLWYSCPALRGCFLTLLASASWMSISSPCTLGIASKTVSRYCQGFWDWKGQYHPSAEKHYNVNLGLTTRVMNVETTSQNGPMEERKITMLLLGIPTIWSRKRICLENGLSMT